MTTPLKTPIPKSTNPSKEKKNRDANPMFTQSVASVPSSPLSPSSLNLPPDPKNWTSTHVATYLHQCLRLHPPPFIAELMQFIQSDASLTGRKFLRLKDDQLRNSGYEDQWIESVMLGVKSLRRNQLKEKILLRNDKFFEGEFEELEECDIEIGENDNEDDSFSSLSNPNPINFNASETFTKFPEPKPIEEASGIAELSHDDIYKWIKKEILGYETFGSGFARGFMLGGAIVWAFMKISKR
ncbi:4288_t:CDS:2 [Acaulospora colombiana]|uniref:4288_t:CDS:1 n=1 Tax=Acaulospora colombiana TaxID=27376 RepID=A0ACA9K596_9GLOM|nr:4288_t:CDS:2 [Acaulospora colombiana]